MKPRIPEIVHSPATFHAYKDHITAIFEIGHNTIGLRFNSPDEMLAFFSEMLEKAAVVWPDNEYIQEYLKP